MVQQFMRIDPKIAKILENAWAGVSASRQDCLHLLACNEHSLEAALARTAASHIIREKSDNSAIILGQIGLEAAPCPGNCGFCSFGKGHTSFEKSQLSEDAFAAKVRGFCAEDGLYGLYLMAMHAYDLDFFLRRARLARELLRGPVQLLANVGDTGPDAFREMKKAGITGVYHVCRLGEGRTTSLDPEQRIKTMENALDAGLQLFSCLEPVGPEHSDEELVDNLFIGISLGCAQHAAMRRVPVPGTPLERRGYISNLRLGQITAVVALAAFAMPGMTYIGVHEPTEIGCVSGANVVTAETGVNPRDPATDTSANRGMDMAACRNMLYDCGFHFIRRGDESKIPLGKR
ncbi:MAG: hypothetical protein LBD37_07390 [Treponema sp.]|jgi:biotin synthase|nr:hypothetical protein [Treponema sp.]